MTIYRERIFAYFIAGIFAISLGFWSSAFIKQAVQPAVSIWITSTAVMILWASITRSFRDPINSIFGIRLRTIIIGLSAVGAILILISLSHSSAGLGTGGVLCVLFAIDTFLSGKESIRRGGNNSDVHREAS